MIQQQQYDAAIIGGGLAGLNLSILLARAGHSVVLFEKETYPFHKVCGEYISLESWNFLTETIGIPLGVMHLPQIKKLLVTAPNGNSLQAKLDLGGFGISRFTLDASLKNIAEKEGVHIYENCKAEEVNFDGSLFSLKTTAGNFVATVCCGSWGKRSNFDVKWSRPFIRKNNSRLNNFVGIKYHVKIDFPADMIALHNFKDGYCGISKIEDEKYCVCYLSKASNIKKAGSIQKAEQQILSKNPYLKKLFENMEHLYDAPLSISQVSFSRKDAVENNVLMLGDAAGMITPLCGNGMSMAMHASKLAANSISSFLKKNTSREVMEKEYQLLWENAFKTRLKTGKLVQYLFGRNIVTNTLIAIMKKSPVFTQKIIGLTHGKTF